MELAVVILRTLSGKFYFEEKLQSYSAEWHILNVIHAVIISYLEIALLLFPARDKCPISLKWFAGGLLHQLTPESRIISPCEWTWSIIYTFALFYHISIVFYCASNDLYFFSIGLIYRKDFINKWSVSLSMNNWYCQWFGPKNCVLSYLMADRS